MWKYPGTGMCCYSARGWGRGGGGGRTVGDVGESIDKFGDVGGDDVVLWPDGECCSWTGTYLAACEKPPDRKTTYLFAKTVESFSQPLDSLEGEGK